MQLLDQLKQGLLYFDGGTGTMFQAAGLAPGELPETWNILHPDRVRQVHLDYLQAGSDILTTNTFGVNALRFPDGGAYSVEQLTEAAVLIAKSAIAASGKQAYVALDLGPTGKLLRPLGELHFEDAVELYTRVVKCGVRCGADLILIETMNDAYETKAAVLAAKEHSSLPVFVTNVYDQNMQLMTGADPVAMVALLEGLGVDALGLNCGLGPEQMEQIVPVLASYASVPLIVNPNAGLPQMVNGQTVFDCSPEVFAASMKRMVQSGARIVGGCCGTTPAHIAALVQATSKMRPAPVTPKSHTLISSYSHAVEIGKRPVLIGERINPTGKPKLKAALREHRLEYILEEAVKQQQAGAQILDVNIGLPEIDEPALLREVVQEVQGVTDAPLQLDTSDPQAMERAMRIYNGKPLVNSVNGKQESMNAVFPLVKKYGGAVIALTLDEQGIPETADGRVQIAKNIRDRAAEYGIAPRDIIVDPLAMTISSDTASALTTLQAVYRIKHELGLRVSLGVSNISFGLPNREIINAAFFALALQNGLDCAIMNPYSTEMMKSYHAFLALSDQDPNCADYIRFATTLTPTPAAAAPVAVPTGKSSAELREDGLSELSKAILHGLRKNAGQLAEAMLQSLLPLELINGHIIPALDTVGKGFEQGTVFLPQLLMSAEAAKQAFEAAKQAMQSDGPKQQKGPIILATVKGDIHDIGKNIVKVLLENYGFQVIDLGKDVEPQFIVDAAVQHQVKLVGLSALMTTTVPSMEQTIRLLHEQAPWCKTVVGGAVLTQTYADMIHADKYAKDAMDTVRYAESIFEY